MQMPFTGERYVPELRGQIYYEHFHRYAIALALVRDKDVMDIACGEGYGTAALALVARSAVGVDNDADSVRHAAARYTAMNIDFRVGDCTQIPATDASVDVVVSFETIEHLTGHERMLAEISRILRPDGRLIISSPNKLVYSDDRSYQNPFHVRELYFHEFRDMLRGFFPEVRLFGQRVFAASAVHPLRGSANDTRWLGPSIIAEGGITALPDPEYFIAICSRNADEALPDLCSVYLDPRDELLADIRSGGLAGIAGSEPEALTGGRDALTRGRADSARSDAASAGAPDRTADAANEGEQLRVAELEREVQRLADELREARTLAAQNADASEAQEVELRATALEQERARVSESERQAAILADAIAERHAALEQLAAERRRNAELERALGEQKADWTAERRTSEGAMAELSRTIRELEIRTEEHQRHSETMRAELADVQAELGRTRQELASSRDELAVARDELSEERRRSEVLRQKIAAAGEELSEERRRSELLHDELEAASKENIERAKEVEQVEVRWREERQRVADELREERRRSELLRDELAAASKEKLRNIELASEIETVAARLRDEQRQGSETRQAWEEALELARRAERRSASLQLECEALRIAQQDAEHRVVALELECEALREARLSEPVLAAQPARDMTAELERLENSLEMSTLELLQRTAERDELAAELAAALEQRKNIDRRIAQFELERASTDELRRRLSETESLLQDVLSSTSWRLMRPARRFMEGLRGGPKR